MAQQTRNIGPGRYLMRLQWLSDNRCKFSFDLEREIARQRPAAPQWKPEYAQHATESLESRGGLVRTDTEHSILLRERLRPFCQKPRNCLVGRMAALSRNATLSRDCARNGPFERSARSATRPDKMTIQNGPGRSCSILPVERLTSRSFPRWLGNAFVECRMRC